MRLMKNNSQTIALVGCGAMGKALLQGWLKAGLKASYLVAEPGAVKKDKRVVHLKKPDKRLLTADVVVLAVKPQVMDDVCRKLKPFISPDALVLSIAAGRSVKSLESVFGKKRPVVRAMPNLPASIGKGATVATANKNAGAAQRKLVDRLLRCVGHVEWLKDEKLMNAATALVGSGPAYVFYMIEVLAESARKLGFDADKAQILARKTVTGGAALAEAGADSAATLRKNVTSPGGTTEAALKILMNGKMQKLFDDALKAAARRGKELSS